MEFENLDLTTGSLYKPKQSDKTLNNIYQYLGLNNTQDINSLDLFRMYLAKIESDLKYLSENITNDNIK